MIVPETKSPQLVIVPEMIPEKWLPVTPEKFSSNYEVSNRGKVRSINTGIILKTYLLNGYHSVRLSSGPYRKTFMIHKLVALAFVLNPRGCKCVNHEDGIKTNNLSSNLTWGTLKENSQHLIQVLGNGTSTISVVQMTLDGEIIKIFSSIKEAGETTGASRSHITSVCRGKRKSAGEFKWKYVTEPIKYDIPEGRQHEDFPGYIVTMDGRVFSIKQQIYLMLTKNGDGYMTICLHHRGKLRYFRVHRLVAELYIPKPPGKDFVNHKDREKHNNNVENLEWVNRSENMIHAAVTNVNFYLNAVIQCLMTGEEIEIFESASAAAEALNINQTGISLVCRGKQKSSGGFFWKYANK